MPDTEPTTKGEQESGSERARPSARSEQVAEAGTLRQAWAYYLTRYEWSHFVTLTTRLATTPEQLRREFVSGYVRRLARIAQGPVPWFYVVERSAGMPHLHALLAGAGDLPLEEVRRAWKHGFTDAERYDSRRGAAFYLTKEMTGRGSIDASPRADDYDVSRRLPPIVRRAAA